MSKSAQVQSERRYLVKITVVDIELNMQDFYEELNFNGNSDTKGKTVFVREL